MLQLPVVIIEIAFRLSHARYMLEMSLSPYSPSTQWNLAFSKFFYIPAGEVKASQTFSDGWSNCKRNG